MASLDDPVGKDELLEALSKTEGPLWIDAVEADATAAAEAETADYDASPEDAAVQDDDGGFQAFLDAPDTAREESQRAVQSVKKPGGVLATYCHADQLEKSLREQRTLKNVDKLKQEFAAKVKMADDVRGALADEEAKLRAIKKQVEAGTLQDPARLGYQEREVSKAWDRLTVCEKARDAVELKLHQAAEDGQRALHKVGQEVDHHVAVARERRDLETKRAKRTISQDVQKRAAVVEQKRAVSMETSRKASEARHHQAMGVVRLKDSFAKHDERMQELSEVREHRFQHDADRVLSFKASLDAANRSMQASNEAKRKKQQKVRAEQEARKEQLLAAGQNPYEVYRREEMEADKEKQKVKLKALNEMRSEKLLEQLMLEDSTYRKNVEEEKQKRLEAEEFQKQMGNYAKEKKVAAYIRRMTIGNVDVLDPTGTALRIDPSKITIQKTHAFGLGRAPMTEIEKVDRDLRRQRNNLEKCKPPPQPGSVDFEELGIAETQEDDARPGRSTEAVDGKLWSPNLTILEEKYLAAAKERQKANITSVQRCWGKEWKGDAFLAKPSIIAFDDFEVGNRYRQVIEVTNVSLTFNQFKLLPLDDKVRDFFEIQFQPPGRMSAGVTRYITLWFCPKVSSDIVSTFPILAKTGRIDFPLRCTTKKTILTVTPQDADANPIIDFGQVLFGESSQAVLTTKNTGALGASFTLEPEDPESDFMDMVTWKSKGSEFEAFNTTKISFKFTPKVVGSFSTALKLTISNGAAGDAGFFEEKRVLLRGSCADLPIYVEKETYDMQTCIYGHIFRESVIIHNRRSVAMQIQVEKPKHLEGELKVNPTLAYIQGEKDLEIQVKFSPRPDFLDRHQQYRDASRKGTAGAFRIPVKIVGAEQVLPVWTELVGTLTTNNISFEPPSLRFGRCFVGSSVVSRLTVVNESSLPQRFVFTRLPGILDVMELPHDIAKEEEGAENEATAVLEGGCDGAFGMLLPNERRQLCVTYTPESATEMNLKVQFKAIAGQLCSREFQVACQGQGMAPPLCLSHNSVDMAAIPCNASSKESVVITNTAKVPYSMNILLPPIELCGLKANPVCCTLAPQQSQRIQLEFHPTKEYVAWLDKPPEPEEDDEEEPALDENGEPIPKEPPISPEDFEHDRLNEIRDAGGRRWRGPEDKTVHANWKLAICMKSAVSRNSEQVCKKETQMLYLGVGTCVLPSILIATPTIMDFGEVTAQQRRIMPLTLQCEAGVEPQELSIEALPENQCFTVLSAPRTVTQKPFQLMVEFHPKAVQICQSVLLMRTQSTRAQVPLMGRGVRPVLKIEPEDGVLRLPPVIYSKEGKDYTQEKLIIKNESPFELCYSLESVVQADPNHTGPPVFTCSPSTGSVEANGTKTVTVTFRPHRPMEIFQEKLLVNVPNQKEPTFVYLYGHCFKYQTFAISGREFGPFARAETKSPVAFVDSMSVGVNSGANAETGEFTYPTAQQREFTLNFADGERCQYLLVGATVQPGFPSAPQNTPPPAWEFQIQQSEFSKYFVVEAPGAKPDKVAKGPVKPGDPPIKVSFTYTPDENSKLKYGDVNLDLLGGIGQWITCKVKGTLSGGFVPPGEAQTREISVELRAYLQQI